MSARRTGEFLGKGNLLYETPPDSVRSRVLAIVFHLFLLLLGLLLSFLSILFIFIVLVSFIVSIIVSILTLQPYLMGPTEGFADLTGGLSGVARIRFAALHKRVRVYENGITRPLDELRSLLHPEEEGEFIPFSSILGFDPGKSWKRCYITVREMMDGIFRPTTIVHKDRRAGVIDSLCRHLKERGVYRVPRNCRKCGKECEAGSWSCYSCEFDRFSTAPVLPASSAAPAPTEEEKMERLKALLGPQGNRSR